MTWDEIKLWRENHSASKITPPRGEKYGIQRGCQSGGTIFVFLQMIKITVFRTNINTAVNGFLDSVVKTYGKGQAIRLSAKSAPLKKGVRKGSNKNTIFNNRNETRSLSDKIFRKLRLVTPKIYFDKTTKHLFLESSANRVSMK